MDPKSQAKFDRTYMAFGSIMNAMQHIVNDKNAESIIKMSWKQAVQLTSDFVDGLYTQKAVQKRGEWEEITPL